MHIPAATTRSLMTTSSRITRATMSSAMLATNHHLANAPSSHATTAASTGTSTASTPRSQTRRVAMLTAPRRATGCAHSMSITSSVGSTQGYSSQHSSHAESTSESPGKRRRSRLLSSVAFRTTASLKSPMTTATTPIQSSMKTIASPPWCTRCLLKASSSISSTK